MSCRSRIPACCCTDSGPTSKLVEGVDMQIRSGSGVWEGRGGKGYGAPCCAPPAPSGNIYERCRWRGASKTHSLLWARPGQYQRIPIDGAECAGNKVTRADAIERNSGESGSGIDGGERIESEEYG